MKGGFAGSRWLRKYKSGRQQAAASGLRSPRLRRTAGMALLAGALLMTSACGNAAEQPADGVASAAQGDATLVIGAYSVARDAMDELLPMFEAKWLAETGQKLVFQESYEASGTQARAIVGGFEADVTLLAMESDVDKIRKAGLITADWRNAADGGMVTRSVVALGMRKGNPKGIHNWDDLTRPGVKVLYPNPKTSGGAQWDINAMYGAGLKKAEAETGKKDEQYAKAYLKQIHANVESLDKSGRASMAAFEYGVGDVIVTYENELLARIKQGIAYDMVVPDTTILIENPAAVVDVNADKHGVRKAAEALVSYLHSEEAQRIFAENGFRPVNAQVMNEVKDRFVQPKDLFGIDYLGGWAKVRSTLYSPKGVWYQVLAGE